MAGHDVSTEDIRRDRSISVLATSDVTMVGKIWVVFRLHGSGISHRTAEGSIDQAAGYSHSSNAEHYADTETGFSRCR
jgi:hypothetical protein